MSESAWPYISMIKSMEKLEERPGSKPGSARKGKKEKGAVGKKGATPQQSSSQLNQVVSIGDKKKIMPATTIIVHM